MNPYNCDQCDWEYVWTMGDRVKAVNRHELAHLVAHRFEGGAAASLLMMAEQIAQETRPTQRLL